MGNAAPDDMGWTTDPQALVRAHAALAAGCAFVTLHAEVQSQLEPDLPVPHTRLLGNQLRELDRFLSILIDEAALFLRAAGPTIRLLARLHNTPRKLGLLHAMMNLYSKDDARLRAVGRIAACLHHCEGRVHAGQALHRDMLLAQGRTRTSGLVTDFTDGLRLAPAMLVAICELYGTIGDRLLAEALRQKSP